MSKKGDKKIVLPKNLQREMIKFFMQVKKKNARFEEKDKESKPPVKKRGE
jgi:hypothetical protein